MTQSRVRMETATGENATLSNRAKGVIILVLVALYFILPVDAIPDVLVGLGQVDDIIVFAIGVATTLARFKVANV